MSVAARKDGVTEQEWREWTIEARLANAFIPVCTGEWRRSGLPPYRRSFVPLNLQILTMPANNACL